MGNRSVFPFDEVGIPPSEPGYGFLSPIVAPVDGIASQRSAEIGGRISQGQQLIVVVQIDNVWTTANFKETQLRKMHVGQRVTIEVDSLDESFDGAVEFMPAATGDRSSLFPPENATGNYVKIVQRLPCGYASTRISATWISCAPACPSSPPGLTTTCSRIGKAQSDGVSTYRKLRNHRQYAYGCPGRHERFDRLVLLPAL
jgi:Barrel-sandwich domain of CusB or HlyD membrane-fusion